MGTGRLMVQIQAVLDVPRVPGEAAKARTKLSPHPQTRRQILLKLPVIAEAGIVIVRSLDPEWLGLPHPGCLLWCPSSFRNGRHA